MRCGRAGRAGRGDPAYRFPKRIRRAARNCADVETAARTGAFRFLAGGRRVWRQGRHERAASRRADGVDDRPAGEGAIFTAGKPELPRKAPCDGNGHYHRLRPGRQPDGHESDDCERLRRVRVAERSGDPARVHTRGRPLPLPECGHHRVKRLYQQHPRRRVPRFRRNAKLFCRGDEPGSAGGKGGHFAVGNPVLKRHPPR